MNQRDVGGLRIIMAQTYLRTVLNRRLLRNAKILAMKFCVHMIMLFIEAYNVHLQLLIMVAERDGLTGAINMGNVI